MSRCQWSSERKPLNKGSWMSQGMRVAESEFCSCKQVHSPQKGDSLQIALAKKQDD